MTQQKVDMMRYCLLALVAIVLAGCAMPRQEATAQQIAEDYCREAGGEVKPKTDNGTTRQYCHLLEGRVVEVNRLYRTEGLTLD